MVFCEIEEAAGLFLIEKTLPAMGCVKTYKFSLVKLVSKKKPVM